MYIQLVSIYILDIMEEYYISIYYTFIDIIDNIYAAVYIMYNAFLQGQLHRVFVRLP